MRDDLDVGDWEVVQVEPDGSSANVWVRDPETSLRWLFKPASDSTSAKQDRDWVEVVVARLAQRLLVPAAQVTLAWRGGEPGSLTRHLIDDEKSGRQLQPGSLLLAKYLPDYIAYDDNDVRANVPGHSLSNIHSFMAREALRPPPGGTSGLSAFGHFAGYLVLDALVANTDRHARNWGLLGRRMTGAELAPSYDHGSSLGFQLSDDRRELKMQAMHSFAEGGRARCFDTQPAGLTLVRLAVEALRMSDAGALEWWEGRLSTLSQAEVEVLVATVPRVSVVARRFVVELVETNRRRLLDVCRDA